MPSSMRATATPKISQGLIVIGELGPVPDRPDINGCDDDTDHEIGQHQRIHRVGASRARSRLIRRHTTPTMTPDRKTGGVIRPALGMK